MTTYKTFEEYLKNELEYDDTQDKINDLRAKEELSDWDYFKYKGRKELSSLLLEKLDYKMLIPCIEEEYSDYPLSPIMAMVWYEYDSYIKDFSKEVKSMITALTEDEIKELKTYDRVGLEIIDILFFHLNRFPSPYSVIDFTYGMGNYGRDEAYSGELKDPFYTFPELDSIYKIKELFQLKSVSILRLFDDGYSDYTDCMDEDKEETRIYLDIIREQLNDSKEIKDIEKLEKLEKYKRKLLNIRVEKEILNSCKGKLSYEASYRLREMFESLTRERESLPSKYRDLNEIEKAIKEVLS